MNPNQFRVTPLFATPLLEAMIDVPADAKEFIKKTEYTRFPVDNGFGTPNKFLLDSPELNQLKQNIMQACQHYIYQILQVENTADFQMTNSWAVKHVKGDESGAHGHANAMLSGVLYIQTDDLSGDILFTKDRAHYNLFTPTVEVPFTQHNSFNAQGWAVRPRDNLLILFPSTLQHSVYPSRSDQERYAVAFNLFAFGKFGYDRVTQLHIKNELNPKAL